jgi:hypothetical protein
MRTIAIISPTDIPGIKNPGIAGSQAWIGVSGLEGQYRFNFIGDSSKFKGHQFFNCVFFTHANG